MDEEVITSIKLKMIKFESNIAPQFGVFLLFDKLQRLVDLHVIMYKFCYNESKDHR